MEDHTATASLTSVRGLPSRGPRTAAVLVLHGGMEHGTEPVAATSGAWFRAWVLAADLARHLSAPGVPDHRVAVRLLRYRQRGWNAGRAPVEDARWALERVRRELGEVPVVLVGHSMGARVAVHVADDPRVAGVVALAPWFPVGEPVTALAGGRLHAAHGRADRVTSFAATEAYVGRAARVAAHAELTDMGDLGHYLVRGAPRWHRFARTAARDILVSR